MDFIAIGDPTDAQIRCWHAVVTAAQAHDHPDEPLPTREQTAVRLLTPAPRARIMHWLAVAPDGSPAGTCHMRVPDDAARPGEIDVQIHPAYRRQGIGRRLLAIAGDVLRAEPGRTVVAQAVAGTPAVPFLEAAGFRCVLVLASLLLRLDDVDADWVAATVAVGRPGYRLERWRGTVPDHLATAFAQAKIAMSDDPANEQPDGLDGAGGPALGLAAEALDWDADRVREMAEVVAKRGDELYTVAAVRDDVVAGFTEVVVPGDAPSRAAQYDTAVVTEHRGRRLGIWLKAAMLEWLMAERPDVREIESDNSDDNAHMIEVNAALGFRTLRKFREYQADAFDLPRRTG